MSNEHELQLRNDYWRARRHIQWIGFGLALSAAVTALLLVLLDGPWWGVGLFVVFSVFDTALALGWVPKRYRAPVARPFPKPGLERFDD